MRHGVCRHGGSQTAGLSDVDAASIPVVSVTTWQMLFEYAQAKAGQKVLIHARAGNVGAYAVQLASQAKLEVVATAAAKDITYVQSLGASRVLVYRSMKFEDAVSGMDIVIGTAGGDTLDRSIGVLQPGGILVAVVSPFPETMGKKNVRTVFFLVDLTTDRFNKLTDLFEGHKLRTEAGSVLPLERARTAHEMLAGAPHKPGRLFWYRNKASRSWTNSLWP